MYCRLLGVSREAFRKHLRNMDKPDKYKNIKKEILSLLNEDECNDTYGRRRLYEALLLKNININIPSERTVYKIMKEMGIVHKTNRKPNGLTKADREARKSDDILKRKFGAEEPFKKAVTDITELKCKNGKLYISSIFDCFDMAVIGLAMDINMKTELCIRTVENAIKMHPELRGAILHSDRGAQYTSEQYRRILRLYGIKQSMNSDGGRCHDNARCESMWARMKTELIYNRYDTEKMSVEEVKILVWRYFIGYWNNRRISSANGGLPPIIKRQMYYNNLPMAA